MWMASQVPLLQVVNLGGLSTAGIEHTQACLARHRLTRHRLKRGFLRQPELGRSRSATGPQRRYRLHLFATLPVDEHFTTLLKKHAAVSSEKPGRRGPS